MLVGSFYSYFYTSGPQGTQRGLLDFEVLTFCCLFVLTSHWLIGIYFSLYGVYLDNIKGMRR